MDQYLEAIISWLVVKCFDNKSIAAELDLARGFRILYIKGKNDLKEIEKSSKRYVVEEALRRIDIEDPRREFLYSYSKDIGLMD